MTVKDDIAEGRALWKSSSILGKLFIAISLVLSTSSVTSLSDVIFDWKGFIQEAVLFYQEWVGEPVRALFREYLDLQFSRVAIDLLIVVAFVMSAGFRTLGVSSGPYTATQNRGMGAVAMIAMWLATLWFLEGTSGTESHPAVLLCLIFFYCFFGYLTTQFETHFALKTEWRNFFGTRQTDAKVRRKARVLYFGYGAVVAAIVLVLGAANSGLSR